MLVFLLVSYFCLYYIRPTEWVPGLVGSPLLAVSGVVSLLFIGAGVLTGRFRNVLAGQTERMMLGYLAAIVLSQASHFYFGGGVKSFFSFLPVVAGFFLVTCFIENKKSHSFFILLLIVLTTILAYEGWLQHSSGFSHGGLKPLLVDKRIEGEIVQLPRIIWYGVFNDPNDLGLALVLVIPFLLNMLLQRRFLIPVAALPLILAAVYYTNSRGTVLAGVVAIASYFIIRYRNLSGALFGGVCVFVLLCFGPSRMSSMSASEESAYGRIEAWYEAYQMFKSNPLFGVGQGMFTEYNRLTAHNSFVLVMAELGIVGLFFFIGLIYYPYNWLWTSFLKAENPSLKKEEIGVVSAVFASLTGALAAISFISRSYMLLPFVAVAVAVSTMRVFGPSVEVGDGVAVVRQSHVKNITLLTVGYVLLYYFIVKVLL